MLTVCILSASVLSVDPSLEHQETKPFLFFLEKAKNKKGKRELRNSQKKGKSKGLA